jgi:two-component system cit operon sensor histidine kinase CitA
LRERIFERGITTKTCGDHGIGLYLIDSYVSQAGGRSKSPTICPAARFFHCLFPPRGAAWRPELELEETDYAT